MRFVVDIWFPLIFQMQHAYAHPRFEHLLYWHYANRETIRASRTSTDPFPVDALT